MSNNREFVVTEDRLLEIVREAFWAGYRSRESGMNAWAGVLNSVSVAKGLVETENRDE